MSEKIAIAVGGTAGHVLPAVRMAEKFLDREIIFLGTGLANNRFSHKLPGEYFDVSGANFSKGLFSGLSAIGKGFQEAKGILQEHQISHILGLGSFHSISSLIAGLYLGIPYTLLELNVYPGKVNRWFSRWAKAVWMQFPDVHKTLKQKPQFIDLNFGKELQRDMSKEQAREFFGLDPLKKTLLVFGGSQGSEHINKTFTQISLQTCQEFQVIHLTGQKTDLQRYYEKIAMPAYVETFLPHMDKAWQAADLVISRSGAGSIRESILYEVPAIFVPYPQAKDNHQWHNAIYIQDRVQGGLCLEEVYCTPKQLLQTIEDLFKDDKQQLKTLRQSLADYKAQAAKRSGNDFTI